MSGYNEPLMEKKTVEALWEAFGDCNRDDDDCIDSPFCGWECRTNVHDIWHWFDEQYARWGGVHALMFPDEHSGTHYYEFSFAASDELLSDGWTMCSESDWHDMLEQSFYGKSDCKLETFEQARDYLRRTFPVTEEYDVNLVNCLNEHTIEQMCYFTEIDAAEFEISCGCKA